MTITEDVRYVGVNDHEIDLFEGHFDVPLGMAYNSYVILDEKVAVMDSVDARFGAEWIANIKAVLGERKPDYLVVQHMEPDHSANVMTFHEAFPEAAVVGNAKTFTMLGQYFDLPADLQKVEVKNNETLSLGKHALTFVFAPMVHWPEVMMTYDACDKILFSADGFGKFGANDVVDPEGWDCEARRYYFGIVGKYGTQVQAVLKKAAGLDIGIICPLHGPVLTEDLGHYLGLYDTWSAYRPEDKGIFIAYTSVYSHTKEAALLLAKRLEEKGCPAAEVTDLAREDMYECVENAFRYSHLVLATTTYNMEIFPYMREFLGHLKERNYQNRFIALMENGTWAPAAAKGMKAALEGCKNLTFAENTVTVKSALKDDSRAQIEALAEELAAQF